MDSSGWREYWANKQAARAEMVKAGSVVLSWSQSRIQLMAPYSHEFKPRAVELGGRWRPGLRAWSFPGRSQRLVVDLVLEVYGKDKVINNL